VLGNRALHLARSGRTAPRDADEFSSACHAELARAPQSWVLRGGWKRAGPD